MEKGFFGRTSETRIPELGMKSIPAQFVIDEMADEWSKRSGSPLPCCLMREGTKIAFGSILVASDDGPAGMIMASLRVTAGIYSAGL